MGGEVEILAGKGLLNSFEEPLLLTSFYAGSLQGAEPMRDPLLVLYEIYHVLTNESGLVVHFFSNPKTYIPPYYSEHDSGIFEGT